MPADPHDPTQLAPELEAVFRRLQSDSGGRVTLSSGRRDTAQQIALRRAHCGTSEYAIYRAPASSCRPPTARPGESKHERGLAMDLGGDLAYVRSRSAELGIHAPVGGEPWHWELENEPTTVGNVPGAVAEGVGDAPPGPGAFEALTDPHTWLRALEVVAGALLVVLGAMALSGADLAGKALGRA